MLSDTSSDYEALLGDEKAHSKLADSEQRRRIGSFLFRRLLFATLILGAVVLCYGSLPRSRVGSEADAWGYLARHHVISGQEDMNRVNSTLGFQKVIAINLPHRLDKKDELTLMGYASDINVDFLPGRLTEDLKESGMPHLRYNINISTLVAAYRAHLDAWQHVVENRLTTALIMEDDIDWDVDVKKQMQRLKEPLAELIETWYKDQKTRISTPQDPYFHQDWDVLNFGYCIERAFTERRHPRGVDPANPPHVLYDDDTVADRNETHGSFKKYMDTYGYKLPDENNHSAKRLVTKAYGPICLGAYAVSLKGASKLLYHSSRQITQPIDNMFAWLIESGKVVSFETMPPIMSQWRIKDGGSKNSDRVAPRKGKARPADEESEVKVNHNPSVGSSKSIRNSIRKNLSRILREK